MEFTTEFLIFTSIVIFLSALVQATIGFGFPMIATPLLAMVTDMKTAVIYVAIPTLVINIILIYSEKEFKKAIKTFYPLAIFAMIGSAIGTQILIYTNAEIFKLLLSISIILYLFIQKYKLEFIFIRNNPKSSLVIFGLSAGIIGGLTNVMAPILIIYYLELKYTRKEIIQSANICFFFGKLIQIFLFSIHGSFTQDVLTISFASLVVVVFAMFIGIYIKNRIVENRYNQIIKNLLFLIAFVLLVQTVY